MPAVQPTTFRALPVGAVLQAEKATFSYDYARPALTVDVVVIRENGELNSDLDYEVLMIRRKNEPFQGMLALPGGFVNEGETPPEAALRELCEETNIQNSGSPHLIGVYGDPRRDPRGWVVSVAYLCQVPKGTDALAGDDATEAAWVPVDQVADETLAFDHNRIVNDALEIW